MSVTLLEVTKLYVATFNRAPDAAGITYWTNSGMPIENIAQSFFDQPETQILYPTGTANGSFVTSVYDNLFNRVPDTAGFDYWVQELDSGSVSKQNFILAVINGAQNTVLSQDATILTNKQTVGLDFVAKGLDNVTLARSVMANVDDTQTSVTTALAEINNYEAPTTLSDLVGHYTLVSAVVHNAANPTTFWDGQLDILANGTIDMCYMQSKLIWDSNAQQWIDGKMFSDGRIVSVDSDSLHLAPYFTYYSPYKIGSGDFTASSDLETASYMQLADIGTNTPYGVDYFLKYEFANDTLILETSTQTTYTWDLA